MKTYRTLSFHNARISNGTSELTFVDPAVTILNRPQPPGRDRRF